MQNAQFSPTNCNLWIIHQIYIGEKHNDIFLSISKKHKKEFLFCINEFKLFNCK